jgi:protein disulfide-isomerase
VVSDAFSICYHGFNHETPPMKIQHLFPPAIALLLISCDPAGPYNANANPNVDIPTAIAQAAAQKKLVLLEFGANWCPDCRKLGESLKRPPLSDVIAENFVVVPVDVGNFDANLDVVEKYGNPIAMGIPAIVVIGPDNRVLFTSDAGELANARNMSEQAVLEFFQGVVRVARAPSD